MDLAKILDDKTAEVVQFQHLISNKKYRFSFLLVLGCVRRTSQVLQTVGEAYSQGEAAFGCPTENGAQANSTGMKIIVDLFLLIVLSFCQWLLN